MRTALALLGILTVAVASLVLAPSTASACDCTIGITAECHSGFVLLDWNIGCLYGCSANITSILRKCGNGDWVVVVTNPEGDHYTDGPLPGTCRPGYTYRFVYTVSCGGLMTVCTTDTDVVHCP
jgi:hypothetical protein